MKKKFIVAFLTITLLWSINGVYAFAADKDMSSISGGWSESSGYYINGVSGITDTYTLGTPVVLSLKVRASGTPSETPDKHTEKD